MKNTPISLALMRPITLLGVPMGAICFEMFTLPLFMGLASNILLTFGIYICVHFALYVAYKIDPTIFSVLGANLQIKSAGNINYWKGDSYGAW